MSIVMKSAPGGEIILLSGILMVFMSAVGALHSMYVYSRLLPYVSCVRSCSCFGGR